MKISDFSKEDIEAMSYGELTELILKEEGKELKIVDAFKKIIEILGLGESEFENQIADYFELITTDKKFVVLEKGFFDLRVKHTPTVVYEEEEEDIPEETENDEVEENEEEEDIFYDASSDEDDLDDGEDLNDLVVIDEEDEEAGM